MCVRHPIDWYRIWGINAEGRFFQAMRIGFLGLGKMGTEMALRLVAAGHELAVWNRSEGRTKPLIREGAIAAATPGRGRTGRGRRGYHAL